MLVADALERMRTLPFADLDEIAGIGPALVLSPHQDDESLGCGGLIAQACARKSPPIVVFVTDGAKSHPGSASFPPEALRALREREAIAALGVLGHSDLGKIRFLRLRDGAAPHEGPEFEDAVELIASIAADEGCASVLSPWRHDPHCDHLAAYRMAAEAARLLHIRHLAYPVWGWLLPASHRIAEKVHGRRLDIRRQLETKKLAVRAHASQNGRVIRDAPDGFCLPAELLAACERDYEVYLDQ